MRKPAPIQDPLFADARSAIQTRSWKQHFGEQSDYYEQVLRWLDPFHPSYGMVGPPASVRKKGLTAYADGVKWNPGEGAGEYWWNGSAWKKIPRIGETATTPLDASWIPFAAPVLTKYFESSEQAITTTLTLAHGLGVVPKLFQVMLKCTTGELGYSVNDLVVVGSHFIGSSGSDAALAIKPDSTNLNIVFSNPCTIVLPRWDTRAMVVITNGNWNIIFRAWA
jgi:hypothetical protein